MPLPPSATAIGEKRPRDASFSSSKKNHFNNNHNYGNFNDDNSNNRSQCPSSSHAAIIEIIHGITRDAAAAYKAQPSLASATLSTLLRSPTHRAQAHRLLFSESDNTQVAPIGPVETAIVRLVANDGATLVFADDNASPLSLAADASGRVCAGDVVLFRRPQSNPHAESRASLTSSSAVEFLGVDPSVLTDASDWSLAVSQQVMSCTAWVRRLLACPPGLPQLTCIIQSAHHGDAAWARSLQLPSFLVKQPRSEGDSTVLDWTSIDGSRGGDGGAVDPREALRVGQVTHALLRIYVAVITAAQSIIDMPRSTLSMAREFVASPLFVDGLTLVLPRLAGAVTESTWRSVQEITFDATRLALELVCVKDDESAEVGGNATLDALEARLAERGCLTVLHRLAAAWLAAQKTHFSSSETDAKSNHDNDPRSTAANSKCGGGRNEEGLVAIITEMARAGVLRRVTQWLRDRERREAAAAAAATNLIDTAHQPPTLRDIRESHGLGPNAVGDMLAAMTQVYTPYLRYEALRFVECAMLAAYAELYGPASRAARRFIESMEGTKATVATASVTNSVQIVELEQLVLRPRFSDYTAREVQLHALFGVPVSITLQAVADESGFSGELEELAVVTQQSSYFVFIVVILHGKPFAFPVILSDVVTIENADASTAKATATAYLLRDADMLPSLLSAEAGAWMLHREPPKTTSASKNSTTTFPTGSKNDFNALPSPSRLLPPDTPAEVYAVYMHHLRSLMVRMRHEDLVVPRAKNTPPKGVDGVIWWDNGSNERAAGENFVPQSPLPGEIEASQRCLTELAAAADLTATQVECLHTLTAPGIGLRALSGAVGSGKTTVMCAAGLTRGRALSVLRRQHQQQWHATIRHSTQRLNLRLAEIATAEEMMDFFSARDATGATRDALEEVATAAVDHIQEHVLLGERMRHCQAPLLLRPRAVRHDPPPHALRVLCGKNRHRTDEDPNKIIHPSPDTRERQNVNTEQQEDDAQQNKEKQETEEAGKEDEMKRQFQSVEELVSMSYQRALNAPLTAVLRERLCFLREMGHRCAAVRRAAAESEASGEWHLDPALLSFIMSHRERRETALAAARGGKSWEAYLAEDLWDSATVARTELQPVSDAQHSNTNPSRTPRDVPLIWDTLEPALQEFTEVELPNASRSLADYGRDEAAAWRAVFAGKQRELLNLLQHAIIDEAQTLFVLLDELTRAVAAASQTSRVPVVAATGTSVMRQLAFCRTWRPRIVVIDDFDHLTDSLFLTLWPVAAMVLSQQVEGALSHERSGPRAVLASLQRSLINSPFGSNVSLAEAQRFTTSAMHTAVQVCRNARVDTRRAAFSAAAAALSAPISSTPEANVDNTSSEGPLPGLSSPSCVELWTHAVPLRVAVEADWRAARFVRYHLRAVDPTLSFGVYSPFVADLVDAAGADTFAEKVEENDDDDENRSEKDAEAKEKEDIFSSITPLPFLTDDFVEDDAEWDVVIICLSGLTQRLGGGKAERWSTWERVATPEFTERLEWWLWRAASRTRRGAILIGSREVFQTLDPLRRLVRLVAHAREVGGYWLSEDAAASALALRCPDHDKSRQLAIMAHSEAGACVVQRLGVRRCRSLCLKPYDNCTNAAHACLRPCHATTRDDTDEETVPHTNGADGAAPTLESRDVDEGGSEAEHATRVRCEKERKHAPHSHCPFPCTRVPSCGHMCVRRCGEPCEPCEFLGLVELPCGQLTVTGMSESSPAFALVRHFQEVRCGVAPRPCEERVTLRCARCGERNAMRCHEASARGGGGETAVLSERECVGCVALYNRVAREFGVEECVQSGADGAGELPIHLLHEEAAARLIKLRGFAARKAQLRLQTEALEAMQKLPSAEYHQLLAVYKERRAQQEEQLQQHRLRAQARTQTWAKILREKFEKQMALNEEIETEVPLMISQALAEEERQESYYFV